jgi:hypothetical protein
VAELWGWFGRNRRSTLAASVNQTVQKILMTWLNHSVENGGGWFQLTLLYRDNVKKE